jgi:hypothetical protein
VRCAERAGAVGDARARLSGKALRAYDPLTYQDGTHRERASRGFEIVVGIQKGHWTGEPSEYKGRCGGCTNTGLVRWGLGRCAQAVGPHA